MSDQTNHQQHAPDPVADSRSAELYARRGLEAMIERLVAERDESKASHEMDLRYMQGKLDEKEASWQAVCHDARQAHARANHIERLYREMLTPVIDYTQGTINAAHLKQVCKEFLAAWAPVINDEGEGPSMCRGTVVPNV